MVRPSGPPVPLPMRLVLATLALLGLAAPASGQGLYRPEAEGGVSLAAATTFNDGLADLSVGAVSSSPRGLDLSLSVGQSPLLDDDALTTLGGAAAWNLDREGPSRASLAAAYSVSRADRIDPIHVLSLGARAGRQARLGGGVRAVPNVSASVSALLGSGLQTSAAVEVPVFFDVGGAEPYVALGVSINSERVQFVEGLEIPLVGLRGGVLL